MSVIYSLAENVHFTRQNWFLALTWESPHAWESHFSSVKISTLQSTSSSHFSVMYNTHNINIKPRQSSEIRLLPRSSGAIIGRRCLRLCLCSWEDQKHWPKRQFHIGLFSFTLPFRCSTSFGFCWLGPHCSQGLFFCGANGKRSLIPQSYKQQSRFSPGLNPVMVFGIWRLSRTSAAGLTGMGEAFQMRAWVVILLHDCT